MRAKILLPPLAMPSCSVISSAGGLARLDGDFWVPVAEAVRSAHMEARLERDVHGVRNHLLILPAVDAESSNPGHPKAAVPDTHNQAPKIPR